MKRCNRPSQYLSYKNGMRLCAKHALISKKFWILTDTHEDIGRCDQPITPNEERLPGESMDLSYSDGKIVKNAIIQIWEDLHNERPGYYRAFWCKSPTATLGSPIIGYCSAGGSHRTIRATLREVRRLGHKEEAYRNGRLIKEQEEDTDAYPQ